jgi:hypothetical protein
MASYSPLYQQDVIWVAEYFSGELLREWDDSGKEHLFSEIEKFRMKKFHLVSADFDYIFDCKTGVFNIDGMQYVFPLAGLDLKYGEGLIHFKEAFTEFVPAPLKTGDYDGFTIASYEFGWKVTHENLKSKVIYNTKNRTFYCDLTILDLQKSISWAMKI